MQGTLFIEVKRMYAYNQKTKRKLYTIASLSVALVGCVAMAMLVLFPQNKSIPIVSQQEENVIPLPDKEEEIGYPFKVDGVVVKEFFDGSDHEVSDFTSLEGVYRPNQGMDFAYNEENFAVLCMLAGEVSEVKEDALFGNSITITTENIKITYQSLENVLVKKGDKVTLKQEIGKAGINTYNPELGNHVHIVVEKNEKVIDPKSVIGKTFTEVK